MIDDAHGIGVLGADGAGSLREAGLDEQQVPILMATLGKALGVCAAFVAGPKALVDGFAPVCAHPDLHHGHATGAGGSNPGSAATGAR